MAFTVKKGSVPLDLILISIVFITILSMTVFIGHYTSTKVYNAFSTDTSFNLTPMNNTIDSYELFDTGLPFLFFAFFTIGILVAIKLRTSPAVAFFLFFVIATIGYIAQSVSNAFYEFASADGISTTANSFDYVMALQNNLGWLILIIGVIILLFTFTKPQGYAI